MSAFITTGTTTRVCLHHHRHDNPCLPASPPARQPVSACITTGTTTRVCLHHHRHDNPCLPASPPARQPVSACITTGVTTRVCLHRHRHDNPCLPESPPARPPVSARITIGLTTRVSMRNHQLRTCFHLHRHPVLWHSCSCACLPQAYSMSEAQHFQCLPIILCIDITGYTQVGVMIRFTLKEIK